MREELIAAGIPPDEWWLERIDECVDNVLAGVPGSLRYAFMLVSNLWRPRVADVFYHLLYRKGKIERKIFADAFFNLYQCESERLCVYHGGHLKLANLLQEFSEPTQLVEPLTVWRGVTKRWDAGHRMVIKGISWTTDLEIACFFASCLHSDTPGNKRCVVRTTIQPDAIIGFLDERQECEMLVHPKKISSVFLEDFGESGRRINTKHIPAVSDELLSKWKRLGENYSAKKPLVSPGVQQ
jgi:hypothetical protein